jgi:hypothetical protein
MTYGVYATLTIGAVFAILTYFVRDINFQIEEDINIKDFLTLEEEWALNVPRMVYIIKDEDYDNIVWGPYQGCEQEPWYDNEEAEFEFIDNDKYDETEEELKEFQQALDVSDFEYWTWKTTDEVNEMIDMAEKEAEGWVNCIDKLGDFSENLEFAFVRSFEGCFMDIDEEWEKVFENNEKQDTVWILLGYDLPYGFEGSITSAEGFNEDVRDTRILARNATCEVLCALQNIQVMDEDDGACW